MYKCYHCGYVFTCLLKHYVRCPNCDSANLTYIPIAFLKKLSLKELNKYGIKSIKIKPNYNNKYVNDKGVENVEKTIENNEQVREINITGRFYTVNIVSNNDEETVDFLIDKALTVLDTIKRRDY